MPKRRSHFDKMTLLELVQLREEIQAVLDEKIATERRELQSKIESLATIEGGQQKTRIKPAGARVPHQKANGSKGQKLPPKYRSPEGDEWSGRGLPPKWLIALERKGKKREQFLIEQ